MKFSFRQILTEEVKSYASHTPLVGPDTLDCSLGVNPYGCPQSAVEALRAFDVSRLPDYPHSHALHKALIEYWAGIAALSEDEITTANGSICGLYYLNNVFSQAERGEVVGFIPTFTDMVESVKSFGMRFTGVPMRMAERGRADAADIIAALGADTALVYIDRPNNPTGQTMSLADTELVLRAALENGSYVIVDEAYGDFIPREESAMTLKNRYDNLIVTKTFSKGFGLANLRGAYIIANAELTACMSRTLNPYIMSDMEREICAAALGSPEHPTAHAEEFAAVKAAVRAVCGDSTELLVTDDRVPIFTLALRGEGDLQARLLEQGVLAVSGREFELLGERYVRLRVPTEERADRLVQAVAALG